MIVAKIKKMKTLHQLRCAQVLRRCEECPRECIESKSQGRW